MAGAWNDAKLKFRPMTEESHAGAPAKIPALLASGAGLLLSILAALWLRSGQERAWAEEVRKLAEDRAEIIRGQLMRSMEVLHAVGAFFTARSEITRGEFRAFTERPLARQPELQALGWDARVPGPERPIWEARARAEGFPHFSFTEENHKGRIVPASQRDEYFPVFYLEYRRKLWKQSSPPFTRVLVRGNTAAPASGSPLPGVRLNSWGDSSAWSPAPDAAPPFHSP